MFMNKSRTIAVKLSGIRCRERDCVVLSQPQHAMRFWHCGILHALRLVPLLQDTAALLSVALKTATLLLLCPLQAALKAACRFGPTFCRAKYHHPRHLLSTRAAT